LGSQGIRFVQVTDGMSNTILVGEKHVPLPSWGMGGWDCSLYNGEYYFCSTRSGGPAYPLAQDYLDPGWLWGSYHPFLCQFAFADGGVRVMSTTIDPVVLGYLCNKDDGKPVSSWE
jgi:hypothetical protein